MDPLVIGEARWFYLPINPEPWAIGPVSVGRAKGKVYPIVGQNQQLNAFKEAIREQLGTGHHVITGKVWMRLFVSRQMLAYVGARGRKNRNNEADATNMQKAIEDACQGILFENDRDVNDIRTVIISQDTDCKPAIILGVKPNNPIPNGIRGIPPLMWDKFMSLEEVAPRSNNEWRGPGA